MVILAILAASRQQVGQVFSRTFKQCGGRYWWRFLYRDRLHFLFTRDANSLALGLLKSDVLCCPGAVLGWIRRRSFRQQLRPPMRCRSCAGYDGIAASPVLLCHSQPVGSEVGKPIAPQTAAWASRPATCAQRGQVIRHNMGWTLVSLLT